ncbi:M28 family metallopeptidase [Marinobacterium sedimentorum]|uniref:M28 family metallopeptidase n=1 Tax=Marinobacterium sedimentorum TaxID=2927804 RepID=UPI0020C725C3|nr:M20/M25/M40 family metallo-hydrolase [Marinobacterium sedimentorum]MCP8688154.1 M28 family metallopeptidase [Marinobacterium sedimentorum]
MNSGLTDKPRSPQQQRLFDWIKGLEQVPQRYAGSAGERQSAELVAGWMREQGLPEVNLETFQPPKRSGRSGYLLALHTLIAGIGCLLGGWIGTGLVLLAAWSIRGPRWFNIGALLPAITSLNAVGHRAASVEEPFRIILSAHIDTNQAGLIFHPWMANTFATRATAKNRGKPPKGPNSIPIRLAIVACLMLGLSLLFPASTPLLLARWLIGLVLLVVCALGLQWALAKTTPGANDNASAVAAMLQAAETLNRELPDDTELWVVATGAEEIGSRGMQAFMNRHQHWPRERCLFINFESVGSTHLHFAVNEGASKKTHYSDASISFAARLAEHSPQGPITPIELMIGTDGRVPARRGYEAVSLVSLEANQVPRNYHRPNDIAEYIDLETVRRAGAFAIEAAHAAAAEKRVG